MVTVFSQPNCVPCRKVKAWLDNKGVDYIERDVTADAEAFNDLKNMGYNTTPVVVAGSDHWAGINLPKMKELIR